MFRLDVLFDKYHVGHVGYAKFGQELFDIYGEQCLISRSMTQVNCSWEPLKFVTAMRGWDVTLTVPVLPELNKDSCQRLAVITSDKSYLGDAYLSGVNKRPNGLWRLSFMGTGKPEGIKIEE